METICFVLETIYLALKLFIIRTILFIIDLKIQFHCLRMKLGRKYLLSIDVNNAMITTYFDDHLQCVTSIMHPAFNKRDLLIVGKYDDVAAAKAGHENWVKTFEKGLPNELKDVTNDKICKKRIRRLF